MNFISEGVGIVIVEEEDGDTNSLKFNCIKKEKEYS